MAEQNFDLPPGTDSVSTMRSKIVNALKALRGLFWGSTEPGASIRDKFMFWADTRNSLLKQRDSSDATWTPLWDPDEGPIFRADRQLRTSNANTLLFSAPVPCKIKRILMICEIATVSDGSNYYTFQVHNRTQTLTLLATPKSTNGADFVADTVYDLGADQNLSLAKDDVLEVSISTTGSPTSLANKDMVVIVEYTRNG